MNGFYRKLLKNMVSTQFQQQIWWNMVSSQDCQFLKLKHHIHSSYKKSIIERTMQYIKDRTKGFDDYFPCRKKKCKLKHVKQWLTLFADYYNKEIIA